MLIGLDHQGVGRDLLSPDHYDGPLPGGHREAAGCGAGLRSRPLNLLVSGVQAAAESAPPVFVIAELSREVRVHRDVKADAERVPPHMAQGKPVMLRNPQGSDGSEE